MGVFLQFLVTLLLGLTEKLLPTFVTLWRERQARAEAEAAKTRDAARIDDAIRRARGEGGPKP